MLPAAQRLYSQDNSSREMKSDLKERVYFILKWLYTSAWHLGEWNKWDFLKKKVICQFMFSQKSALCAKSCVWHIQGQGGILEMGMGSEVAGQLQIKALVHCSTSVSMLLLDSGASAYSLFWEKVFFPMDDRHPKESERGKACIQSSSGVALWKLEAKSSLL